MVGAGSGLGLGYFTKRCEVHLIYLPMNTISSMPLQVKEVK